MISAPPLATVFYLTKQKKASPPRNQSHFPSDFSPLSLFFSSFSDVDYCSLVSMEGAISGDGFSARSPNLHWAAPSLLPSGSIYTNSSGFLQTKITTWTEKSEIHVSPLWFGLGSCSTGATQGRASLFSLPCLKDMRFVDGLLVGGEHLNCTREGNGCAVGNSSGKGEDKNPSGRRAKSSYRSPMIKGQWSAEEDGLLVKLVEQYGERKWSHIARKLVGRIGKQCRERWHNHLRPDIKKDTWSEEEEKLLVEVHEKMGNKWAEIAKLIPGRTENAVKNHWNATKRKQKSRKAIGKATTQRGNSHPSVLENYIIGKGKSVLEDHIICKAKKEAPITTNTPKNQPHPLFLPKPSTFTPGSSSMVVHPSNQPLCIEHNESNDQNANMGCTDEEKCQITHIQETLLSDDFFTDDANELPEMSEIATIISSSPSTDSRFDNSPLEEITTTAAVTTATTSSHLNPDHYISSLLDGFTSPSSKN